MTPVAVIEAYLAGPDPIVDGRHQAKLDRAAVFTLLSQIEDAPCPDCAEDGLTVFHDAMTCKRDWRTGVKIGSTR